MEEPALRQKRNCSAETLQANMATKAAITATVALVFWAAYLLSWEASESIQQRAVQAKTITYNEVLRAKQLNNCSVSHSFSWTLYSHTISSDKQYCILLAQQVEVRSDNIHLRRVYCTKCPTSCPSYKEICADRTCFAAPTVPVPRNTQPWPASCAHVTTGTPCTASCKAGYKPATEGSPPSATCMTGDIAGESPYQDAWSPALGSCVPDRLELQQVVKAMKVYHIIEGLTCLLWCYCVWYLRVFGLSPVTNLLVITKSILHITLVKPDLWALHRLVELSTVVMGIGSMANSMEAVKSLVVAAVACLLVTGKWFALPCSMLCEYAYAQHSFAAYYLTVCFVEPAIAVMAWTLALGCVVLKPFWHIIQPGLAHGMNAFLQLSGQVFMRMHCIHYFEVDLNLQLDSVDDEVATILFEDQAETRPRRGTERGGSRHHDGNALFASNSTVNSCFVSFVNGVDFVLLRIQGLVKAVLVALRLDSSHATHTAGTPLICSELNEPLDTITEGDEAAESSSNSGNSSKRASDAVDSEIKPAATAEPRHSGVAAAHAKAGVISFGPLMSFGSDVNGVVQIALNPQSAGKKEY